MSTVNQITVSNTSEISVVTAGTQGVAGPNTILSRSVVGSTATTTGSLLVYDHANLQWEDSQSSRSQSLTAKLYNLGFTSGGAVVTGTLDEDNLGSNSNTKLATQQSIKSYVDSQNAAQDVDYQGDTGGTQSVTINSEVLTISGGTGINTVGSNNAITVHIDNTVTTLVGSQTLTNKTLTSPVINTGDINNPDLDGGTIVGTAIDNSIIGANTPVAITGTAITATSFVIGSATITEAELEIIDGATLSTTEINYLDGTLLGTVVASKVLAADSDKDITGFRNITLTGELDAGSLDVSGNVDVDGVLEADAITVDGKALNEFVSDTVGAMISSNTESGITVVYQDSDNTLDFDVNDPVITLSGDVAGSATMTNLGNVTISTTIQANSIALGTDTTGNYIATVAAGEGIDVANSGTETAAITISAEDATSSNKGIASFDSTDFAVSSGAVTLVTERVQDIVGAMVSETDSGIAVTYNDSAGKLVFNTIDPTITLAGDLSGSITLTDLASGTLTATIVANSVALATDTTGNYIATIAAGEGIDVSGSGSENSAVTISAEDATASNKGVASFDSTDFAVSSGAVTIVPERIQDLVGAMVSSNTESGISVVYQDGDGTLDFDIADFSISLTGDVVGSGTVTNAGNVSFAATIQANSVALATDTTGNYVATIADAGNTHITVANSGSENAAVTLNIADDAIDTDQIANNAVTLGTQSTGNYVATIAGTANEIEVSGSGSETAAVTVGLPDNVTVGGNLIVTGNFTVNGTETTINTASLSVEDLTVRVGKNATSLAATNGAGLEFGASSGKPTLTWDNGNSRLSSNKPFYAASLIGALTGNASTATTLETTRAIALSGDVVGTANFDGSSAISISTTIQANSVALGADTTGNYLATLAQSNSGIDVANSGSETAAVTVGLNTEYVQDLVGAMLTGNTETGIAVTYQDSDGTVDFVIGTGVITNGMLAGSIANGKLANSAITVSDGSNTTAVALGGTITYAAGEGLDVAESSGTVTFSAEDATDSNKGVASFTNHFSVSSGAVSMANSGVSAAAYGSSTAIPVITIDAQGRITNASTAAINTNFTLSADSGSNDTFSTGGTLTFTGGQGIDTTVSNDTITIAAELATETNAGVATFDGTDFTVSSGDVTINSERIADIVGAMVGSNTESGISVVYQDGDNTLDFTVGTLNQDTTGLAATATILATARNIGGVSFNGSADINLAGVNTAGNQNTSGNAATATLSSTITATANNSADETVYITFVDGATGAQGIETDTGLSYNPSTGLLTLVGLDISGNVDVDGTLETDALTVDGKTIAELISDTVGAMVTSNTETGMTVSYEDSDNTLDFVIGTLNQDTTGTAALATSITVTANNSADETVYPLFADGATGAQGAETDTGLTYNPSTGLLTATGFSGALTGTLQTAAQTNVTSLGTLASLVVTGDVTINTNVLKVDTTNNRVGVRTASPSYSLDVGTATDAILIAKGTTAQRPSAAAGLFRYNTSLGRFEGYTDAWGEIGGGGSNTYSVDNYTAPNGSTRAYTLSQIPTSEDNLIVFVGGVFQNPNDFVLSGTTLTLDEAPPSGTRIVAYSVRAAVSGSNLNNDQFTASGSAGFTLSIAPVTENNTMVFIDGVYQQKTDYAVSGTTLTFDTAPTSGAIVEVATFTQTDINVPVDNTITTAKIVNANVTLAKMAANSVDSDQYVDASIDAAHLSANVISGLIEVTPVSGDKMMILDATDSALKKADVNEIMAAAVSVTSAADAVALQFDSSENAAFTGTVTANAGVIVDNTTFDANKLTNSSGHFIIDSANDILLDADGGNINLRDDDVPFGNFNHNGNNLKITSSIQDGDILLTGSRAAGDVTALSLDMSDGGAATFSSSIKTGNTTLQNTQLTQSVGNFVMDVAGNIHLDGAGAQIKLLAGAVGQFGNLYTSSNHFYIKSHIPDKDLRFEVNDSGSDLLALKLHGDGGHATFTGIITANAGIQVDALNIDGRTIASTDTNGDINISPNGTGNVNVNTDSFQIIGTENESARLALIADEADNVGDIWSLVSETNNTLTINTDISSSPVAQITLTPHATVASSTTAIAGNTNIAGTLVVGSNSIAQGVMSVRGSNSGTNPAATGHMASTLQLMNGHNTNGSFSGIDFNNQGDLVDARIVGIHANQSSRHGEIAFLVHNGSALTERMRLNKDGNLTVGGTLGVTGLTTLTGNLTMMSNTVYASQVYVHDRLGHLNDADTYIDFGVDTIEFAAGGTDLNIDTTAFFPSSDGTIDLGKTGKRWANIYTGDLHLSNEGSAGNEVDGTNGNWTIQEGDEHLFIKNNKTGKKYKFALEEIK
jgi:hypothetical protein